jgi:hypothetical protein
VFIFQQGSLAVLGSETLTVPTSGTTALTAAQYDQFTQVGSGLAYGAGGGTRRRACYAVISCETNNVRFQLDTGRAPSSTVGHLLTPGNSLELLSYGQIKNILFQAQGGSATLQVTYFSGN